MHNIEILEGLYDLIENHPENIKLGGHVNIATLTDWYKAPNTDYYWLLVNDSSFHNLLIGYDYFGDLSCVLFDVSVEHPFIACYSKENSSWSMNNECTAMRFTKRIKIAKFIKDIITTKHLEMHRIQAFCNMLNCGHAGVLIGKDGDHVDMEVTALTGRHVVRVNDKSEIENVTTSDNIYHLEECPDGYWGADLYRGYIQDNYLVSVGAPIRQR